MSPSLIWLHGAADVAIIAGCYCMAAALAYLLLRRGRPRPSEKPLVHRPQRVAAWIGWFMLGCGTTHLVELQRGYFWADLWAHVITAIAAVGTAATIWRNRRVEAR